MANVNDIKPSLNYLQLDRINNSNNNQNNQQNLKYGECGITVITSACGDLLENLEKAKPKGNRKAGDSSSILGTRPKLLKKKFNQKEKANKILEETEEIIKNRI